MKNFSRLFLFFSILILFTAMTCEDEPFASKNLFVPNLIQIDTLSSYSVNDSLFVNVDFSRFLPENGYNNLVDIFKTSNSKEFYFILSIQKKDSNNTWINLDLNTVLHVKKGNITNFEGISVLNLTNNRYEFRAAFPTLDSGNYRLSISRNLYHFENNKFTLTISTTIEQLNDDGFYYFTVN